MQWTILLLVIFWVVIPILAKNSQKKAKAEEERRRAMRQQAPQPQRAQQPMRTTPIAPSVRPTQATVSASGEGSASTEGFDGSTFEGELPHDVKPDLATAKSTLTEAKISITHTVTISSESGHAHEESSASGVAADCPPEKAPAKQTAAATPAKAESAFVWDANAVRSGLVMGEILGPCLANRD
ncbi:MAG TPA: hypothetical protein VN538_13890 [Clostridia bacterium]|jgi:hypothetical protein|nr:hypothetical protein [Clostridia bacterium]